MDEKSLPEVLATDEAMALWRKAQRAGYVDEHFQPLLSRTQAALLADAMAERLGIKEKWKVFEGLWNRKYMRSDYNQRAAYAHFKEHRKHIASFCGTGNNAQFLSDPTGNRRWLPFEVKSIESPREHPFDYEGIYSQAYALYQQGFRYWFTQDEIVRLQQHNSQFEAPKLEKELVHLYFRKPVGIEGGIFMPVARAMQIVSANISQKISAVHLGRAFTDLGYKRVKHDSQRGYIVVQRTGEEIAAAQRAMADEATPERDSGQ